MSFSTTSSSSEIARASLPTTPIDHTPEKKQSDKTQAAAGWETGTETSTTDHPAAAAFSQPVSAGTEESKKSESSSDSETAIPQSAVNAALKMSTEGMLQTHFGNQRQGGVQQRLCPTLATSLIFTVGGFVTTVVSLGFLMNDVMNHPEALAANPGRQALYGVGITAGIFSTVIGFCCVIAAT
jgi:hypothetical protein